MAGGDAAERALALFALDQVRKFGGVLEHPRRSALWESAALPKPGAGVDRFGGFTLGVHQREFGHRAEKATLLYIVGLQPSLLPPVPLDLRPAERIIGSPGIKRDGTRSPKRPEVSKAEREATPEPFAIWLCEVARRARYGIQLKAAA